MKFNGLAGLLSLGLGIALALSGLACNRKSSWQQLTPAAAKNTRLAWNQKTLLDVYKQSGFSDARWDDSVQTAFDEFARSRAGLLDPGETYGDTISDGCQTAISVGCKDPMIAYLYARFGPARGRDAHTIAMAYLDAAKRMQSSSYPDIRKFYASLRAVNQLYDADGTNVDQNEINQAGDVEGLLLSAIQNQTMPPDEAYEACSEALADYDATPEYYTNFYARIETVLNRNWPADSQTWLLKGEAFIAMAWQARGSGYADTVTPDGAKLFDQRLVLARKYLEYAWKLNPQDGRIPRHMLTVELGQGSGRDGMELWFSRAMKLNSNDYAACSAKLQYIEPKWYGSTDEMLKFGRECATNPNWNGEVPLVLVDAHVSIQRQYASDANKADYWKQPDVWSDIQTAFDRFFELNPDATGWYHNYTWFAYQAGQWDKLNELLPKLGPVNYNYFGGKDAFEQMVQLAKEHARTSSAANK
jgi:hypothetical protein